MANDSGGKILTEYTIIAGINGAGKSTLFNAGYLVFPKESVRINSDELIQKNYNNQWHDVNIQIAKELLYIRETIPSYLKNIIDEYIITITIHT